MAYFEISPTDSGLKPYLECFWVKSDSFEEQRIVPDACTDIIFKFQENFLKEAIIVGTMTQAHINIDPSSYSYIGLRFQPGAITGLLKLPLNELTDKVLSLHDLNPLLFKAFKEIFLSFTLLAERCKAIETLLLKYLKESTGLLIAQYLLQYKGRMNLTDLINKSGYSTRQVQRIFKEQIGVSPLLLNRIIRFREVYKILHQQSIHDESLLVTAFDNGYTDHAHLTKEFKTFSGVTPSYFKKS